ncbi:MAG TPA: HlyD family efflux transporter periplasmic adaptor subunit [bacterium]|nr:HlyD family efflux transporter periplasmic adaptor subunit [bacterium]
MNMRPNPIHRTARSRAVLVATAALLAACSTDDTVTDSTINLYTVSREDLPINVKEGGELVAVNEVEVKSQIEGSSTILWLIPEGTQVKKGDKLVELDVTQQIEKHRNQEIAVEKARNALEQARNAQEILEKELQANLNTAESKRQIAAMELQKLLGAKDGSGSEGKNADMVQRLEELVNPKPPAENETKAKPTPATGGADNMRLVAEVHPQNYAGLIPKVKELLTIEGDDGDPLQRDMGEMANKILQQVDQIRLAMADLKVKEDTAVYSRRLYAKEFITRNELERDELAYQSQASKVTIAWNDLELLINYTLQKDKIEMRQNLENAELDVARVKAKNDAERKNSQFDVEAKQKEFEVACEQLATLKKQIDNAVLYAPSSGLVVYSKVSRGRGDSEPVEEGTTVRERQTIILLPDNSKLECKIQVQEAMVSKVRRGMPALISAEVRPNEVLTGHVTYVAPVADSASRWSGNDKKVYTTKVLLDGINHDESLKAGMKASATITVDTIENVLTVPIQAVRRDRAVNYVWKHTEQGPVPVPIEIGANNQEKVEVKSGVAEGDQIYRTPPGGQADPKFPQPEAPEGAPDTAAAATAAVASSHDGDSVTSGSRPSSGGGRRAGMLMYRKRLAEMTPAELGEVREAIQSASGFIDMIRQRSPERADAIEASYAKIESALDSGNLPAAQAEIDKMRATMRRRGGSRRGGE